MNDHARPRFRRLLDYGASAATYLAVALCGLYLIWPVPTGRMPLSADHLVHLARGSLLLEQLGRGHIAGWSPHWYFGFPLGELYPPTGDLSLAALYSLGLGHLSIQEAYAFIFAIAFVGQGLVVARAARLFGAGRLAAAIAGVLLLTDPGSVREGGWRYTVSYGVWLQPVAVALIWWAFGQLAAGLRARNGAPLQARMLVGPASTLGLALLTHPIVVPMISVGVPLFALTIGLRSRIGVGRALLAVSAALGVGGLLTAWWMLPLYVYRHWMSSYGVIYGTFARAAEMLSEGQWAHNMASAVGFWIGVGLVRALGAGGRSLLFVALFTLALYLAHIGEFFAITRLDWLSEGFLSIQFQRFIICAKPGLFIAAGLGMSLLLAPLGWRWSRVTERLRVWVYGPLAVAGTAAVLESARGEVTERMVEHKVGAIEVAHRRPKDRSFDAELQRFTRWARRRYAQREGFFRMAYQGPRHDHSFMDGVVDSRAPTYKIGFTPGEVFVHKPEGASMEILERLRVRYVATTGSWQSPVATEVMRFGDIKVWELPLEREVAEVEGAGAVEVLEEDYAKGVIRARVSGADASSRVVFNVAGYPRWQLLHDGQEVEWFEVPAVGDAPPATQAARRARLYREGSPAAPDGSEPMLMAVEGEGDGEYVLRYRFWQPIDSVGLAAFVAALGLLGLALVRPRPLDRALAFGERLLSPKMLALVGGAVVLVVTARYVEGYRREAATALGWFYARHVGEGAHVSPGVMKVSRLLSPAVMTRPQDEGFAWVVFPRVAAPTGEDGERPPIAGWYAASDESVGKGISRHRLRMEFAVRAAGSADPWVLAGSLRPSRRAGKHDFEIATTSVPAGPVDVLVVVWSGSTKDVEFGFNLDLGAPAR